MKFAFFGTPYVARDTLTALAERGYTPAVVITNPDAPKGRGHVLTPSETKVWALEHNIPVLTPATLDDAARDEIVSYGCEFAVVVAYGKILPESLINAFPKGVYNVHYSLLPKHRGASPVETALLHDETETGVTIQRMVKRLDAGDVVAARTESILPSDTTGTLRARLIEGGAKLLIETILLIDAGKTSPVPQDEANATYASKLTKENGLLDLAAPARENWNKYRAYSEWPGTYLFAERNGERTRIKITKAEYTPEGEFKIRRVITEGKKEMDYDAYLRSAR